MMTPELDECFDEVPQTFLQAPSSSHSSQQSKLSFWLCGGRTIKRFFSLWAAQARLMDQAVTLMAVIHTQTSNSATLMKG